MGRQEPTKRPHGAVRQSWPALQPPSQPLTLTHAQSATDWAHSDFLADWRQATGNWQLTTEVIQSWEGESGQGQGWTRISC